MIDVVDQPGEEVDTGGDGSQQDDDHQKEGLEGTVAHVESKLGS